MSKLWVLLPVIWQVKMHDDWSEFFVYVSLRRSKRETRNSHLSILVWCFPFSGLDLYSHKPVILPIMFPEFLYTILQICFNSPLPCSFFLSCFVSRLTLVNHLLLWFYETSNYRINGINCCHPVWFFKNLVLSGTHSHFIDFVSVLWALFSLITQIIVKAESAVCLMWPFPASFHSS